MQMAVVEFARNVLGLTDANSSEFDEITANPDVYKRQPYRLTMNWLLSRGIT